VSRAFASFTKSRRDSKGDDWPVDASISLTRLDTRLVCIHFFISLVCGRKNFKLKAGSDLQNHPGEGSFRLASAPKRLRVSKVCHSFAAIRRCDRSHSCRLVSTRKERRLHRKRHDRDCDFCFKRQVHTPRRISRASHRSLFNVELALC